jgi:hypothetical protein
MIHTNGGRFGGYGLYLLKGKPVFVWNLLNLKGVRWEGPEALSPGKHTIEFEFKYDGLGFATLAFNDISGIGRSGTGLLQVDDNVVANNFRDDANPTVGYGARSYSGLSGAESKLPIECFEAHGQSAD